MSNKTTDFLVRSTALIAFFGMILLFFWAVIPDLNANDCIEAKMQWIDGDCVK